MRRKTRALHKQRRKAGWGLTHRPPSHRAETAPRDRPDRKTPITAAEILNDRVVPFYDEHDIRLCRVLTDRGTEFCGRESHEYELYLAVRI